MTAITFLFLLAAATAQADPGGHWQAATVDDPSAYAEVHAVSQDSRVAIKDASASNDVVPRLEFRCTAGDPTITARIDWKRFISSFSTEAGFKVDGGRFTWLKWKMDSSEAVTYSPSADDSRRLLELLADGTDLVVEISPYSEAPVIAEFNLDGLSKALADLGSKCE